MTIKERSFVYRENDSDRRHGTVLGHAKTIWARRDKGRISEKRSVINQLAG